MSALLSGHAAEAVAKRAELRLGDGFLDQREELPFFEVDVSGEALAEIVEELDRGRVRDTFRITADQHVVLQHPHDDRIGWVAVHRLGRYQELFLDSEVLLLL